MDDFHPEQVASQVPALKKLTDARNKLSDLLNKLDGNDKLEELLQDVVSNTDSLEELGKATGGDKGTEE